MPVRDPSHERVVQCEPGSVIMFLPEIPRLTREVIVPPPPQIEPRIAVAKMISVIVTIAGAMSILVHGLLYW